MSADAPGTPAPEGDNGNPVVAWVRAIALGVRDTARDVLQEGRHGAREAYDEAWERYEDKTRRRRQKAAEQPPEER